MIVLKNTLFQLKARKVVFNNKLAQRRISKTMGNIEDIETKWTIHYINYLNYREKGLRKEAFNEWSLFFSDFKNQETGSRRWFIDIANSLARQTSSYSLYLPMNLVENLIKPEIGRWIVDEPNNPLPYKWSSDFNLLKRAVELHPNDNEALMLFFKRLLNGINMNQHEIGAGYPYDGDPEKDLASLEDAEQYLSFVEEKTRREDLKRQIAELKLVAKKFIKN